jgi:hypothetical protein
MAVIPRASNLTGDPFDRGAHVRLAWSVHGDLRILKTRRIAGGIATIDACRANLRSTGYVTSSVNSIYRPNKAAPPFPPPGLAETVLARAISDWTSAVIHSVRASGIAECTAAWTLSSIDASTLGDFGAPTRGALRAIRQRDGMHRVLG